MVLADKTHTYAPAENFHISIRIRFRSSSPPSPCAPPLSRVNPSVQNLIAKHLLPFLLPRHLTASVHPPYLIRRRRITEAAVGGELFSNFNYPGPASEVCS